MFQNDLVFHFADLDLLEAGEGLFARKVLVLLSAHEAQNNAYRDFLAKVLAAAGLSLAQDVLLVPLPTDDLPPISRLLAQKQAEKVLVFGFKPDTLGLHLEITSNQPFHFLQADWLFSESLATLEPDKTKKSQLWAGMKALFGI